MASAPAAPPEILDALYEVIEARRDERPEGSYVVTLLDGGWEAMAAKIREEADEVCVAARDEGDDALAREVADLVFHVFVVLASRGVAPEAVYGELARRFGIGGLDEKAARASGQPGLPPAPTPTPTPTPTPGTPNTHSTAHPVTRED